MVGQTATLLGIIGGFLLGSVGTVMGTVDDGTNTYYVLRMANRAMLLVLASEVSLS